LTVSSVLVDLPNLRQCSLTDNTLRSRWRIRYHQLHLAEPCSAIAQGSLHCIWWICGWSRIGNIKKEIVKAQETDTELVLRRWRNTSRLYKNKVSMEAAKIERESTTGKFEEVAPWVSGKRGRQVFITGDPDEGVSNFSIPL